MYYHQKMKNPDQKKFTEAMVKDFNNRTKRKHWKVVAINKVTTGTMILYSIWSTKRKRDIISGRVMEWK